MIYKINKEKCIGCGLCVSVCDDATKLNQDNKAEIINQQKLEKCGGVKICPVQAIEKMDNLKK